MYFRKSNCAGSASKLFLYLIELSICDITYTVTPINQQRQKITVFVTETLRRTYVTDPRCGLINDHVSPQLIVNLLSFLLELLFFGLRKLFLTRRSFVL